MAESVASGRRLIAREREQKAFELRKAGASFRQIGRELGISMQAANKACRRVLANLRTLTDGEAEEVRRMEIERLDTMLLGLWDRARQGRTDAVDRVLKIMQRRAELLGLDKQQKTIAQNQFGVTVAPMLDANGAPTFPVRVVFSEDTTPAPPPLEVVEPPQGE